MLVIATLASTFLPRTGLPLLSVSMRVSVFWVDAFSGSGAIVAATWESVTGGAGGVLGGAGAGRGAGVAALGVSIAMPGIAHLHARGPQAEVDLERNGRPAAVVGVQGRGMGVGGHGEAQARVNAREETCRASFASGLYESRPLYESKRRSPRLLPMSM